jgi:hypothetical protein
MGRWRRYRAVRIGALLGQRLILHAGVFEQVGPFSARAGVTVLEVLAEVVGTEELLRLVAFAEFMSDVEVGGAGLPADGSVRKLVATVATNVGGWVGSRRVEGSFDACQSGAGPRMAA